MHNNLNILLSILIHKYFPSWQCLIYISDSVSPRVKLPFGKIQVNIGVESDISEVPGQIFQGFGCQNFILNVDDPSVLFVAIEQELTKRTERFNNRKYVIVSKYHDFKIFNTYAINFVQNILLIHLDKVVWSSGSSLFNKSDVEVSFWAHKFSGTIENNMPYMLDKWFSANGSFAYGNNLFADKLSNLHGRKIRVGAFDYRPCVIIEKTITQTVYSGTELHALTYIMKHINATMEIVIPTAFWGKVFPNGSSLGLVGDLLRDRIDIGAAGLYITHVSAGTFDVTNPHSEARLTVLVPAPRMFAPALSPLIVFILPGWIHFFLTYFVLGLAVYLMKYWEAYKSGAMKQKKMSKLALLRDTMEAVGKPLISQPLVSKQYYFKPLMAVVLWGTITLVAAYTSSLACLMTRPIYEAPIRTVDDFLDSNIKWTGIPGEWMMGWAENDDGRRKRAVERFLQVEPDQLKKFAKEGKLALLVERIRGRLFIYPFSTTDVKRNYKVIEGNFVSQYVTFILRKNSILLPVMNRCINRIIESGLIRHVLQRIPQRGNCVIQEENVRMKFGAIDELVVFDIEYLGGAFLILVVGNLVATATFLIEVMLNNRKTNIKMDRHEFLP